MSSSTFWPIVTEERYKEHPKADAVQLSVGVIKTTPYGMRYLQWYKGGLEFIVVEQESEQDSETKIWDILSKREYEHKGETKELVFRSGTVILKADGSKYMFWFDQPDAIYLILEHEALPEIR